jgi:hypothetical protein
LTRRNRKNALDVEDLLLIPDEFRVSGIQVGHLALDPPAVRHTEPKRSFVSGPLGAPVSTTRFPDELKLACFRADPTVLRL